MEKVFEIDTFLTNVSLYFDEDSCTGCGTCEAVCPKEAIELGPTGAVAKRATEFPILVVDEEKCSLCGICDTICPFGAFRLEIDGERAAPIADLKGFPRLVKKVEHDEGKCKLKRACVDACPMGAILVEDGRWEIDMNLCVTCPRCEDACPNDAIKVTKLMEGEIEMDPYECPGGCAVCLEICPTDAIYEPEAEEPWEEADRVAVDDRYCIYCGACANACPVEGAIKIVRREIRTEEVESMIWDRSRGELFREIKSGGAKAILIKNFLDG